MLGHGIQEDIEESDQLELRVRIDILRYQSGAINLEGMERIFHIAKNDQWRIFLSHSNHTFFCTSTELKVIYRKKKNRAPKSP